MQKILIFDFLSKIDKKDIETTTKIFNEYSENEKHDIIYLFCLDNPIILTDIPEQDYQNNYEKLEIIFFKEPLFHSICKELLIQNKFSKYLNIFYKKLITIVSNDTDYIFHLIKFTNNLDILKNNPNIKFSRKQKEEILILVKKKIINDCYLKEIIINKIGFYDDILLQFKDKPTIEDINLFKKHFLKIQNLKKIKNMVINIFFNYIHQYNIEDVFRKELFINFVLEHPFIYKTIKIPLINSLNKTHYTMFDDLFKEIDDIFLQRKNLENF